MPSTNVKKHPLSFSTKFLYDKKQDTNTHPINPSNHEKVRLFNAQTKITQTSVKFNDSTKMENKYIAKLNQLHPKYPSDVAPKPIENHPIKCSLVNLNS
jgi:hypothetical protein